MDHLYDGPNERVRGGATAVNMEKVLDALSNLHLFASTYANYQRDKNEPDETLEDALDRAEAVLNASGRKV